MNGLQFRQLFGLGCSVNKPAPHLAPRRLYISVVEPECLRGQTTMNSHSLLLAESAGAKIGVWDLTVSHFHSSEHQKQSM